VTRDALVVLDGEFLLKDDRLFIKQMETETNSVANKGEAK
jgi:hypothetical protein